MLSKILRFIKYPFFYYFLLIFRELSQYDPLVLIIAVGYKSYAVNVGSSFIAVGYKSYAVNVGSSFNSS